MDLLSRMKKRNDLVATWENWQILSPAINCWYSFGLNGFFFLNMMLCRITDWRAVEFLRLKRKNLEH